MDDEGLWKSITIYILLFYKKNSVKLSSLRFAYNIEI